MLKKISKLINELYKYTPEGYLKTLASNPEYEDMLISLALEGSANAIQLLHPYARPSEVAACSIAYKMRRKLQQQSQESRHNEGSNQIHDHLCKIPLSEGERRNLQKITQPIISEILHIFECTSGVEIHELEKNIVEHLQSFEYLPNTELSGALFPSVQVKS